MRSGSFGQLHGVAADRAAGSVDEHALPGFHPGVFGDRLPSRQTHHR
jgi:hypothetical protein